MPPWITPTVLLHVAAGILWLFLSLSVVVRRREGRWALGLQMGAALVTILAGIALWHARHAGPQGPTEHMLTIGTVCALIALGLQVPLVGSALARRGAARLEGGSLVAAGLALACLVLAAVAMIGSRYA